MIRELLYKIFFKIKLIKRKFQVIPEMSEKRSVIEFYRKIFEPKVMVETGTFFGDTIEYFKSKFETLYSIELSEELAERAVKRFANDMQVKIVQGDSGIVLKSILSEINSPVLFWLDGHYSSEFYIKGEFVRTAKGATDTPVKKELDIILQSKVESIILIDDARLFNGINDYPTIKEVRKKVKSYNANYSVFVKKDIIHIIPKKVNAQIYW